MTFETINFILFDKNKNKVNQEQIDSFNPYLLNKTFSFYDDGSYCDYINNTTNRYMSIFEKNEDKLMFSLNIIPKLKKRKIKYIKKTVKEKEENIVIPEFYSKREIDMINRLDKYLHE